MYAAGIAEIVLPTPAVLQPRHGGHCHLHRNELVGTAGDRVNKLLSWICFHFYTFIYLIIYLFIYLLFLLKKPRN